MDTSEEARDIDISPKSATQETLQKDQDVKINGDINGSCDESSYRDVEEEEDEEEGDEEEEDGVEGEDSVVNTDDGAVAESDGQHNGEARQNGVEDEQMDVDDGEETSVVEEAMDDDTSDVSGDARTLEESEEDKKKNDEFNANGESVVDKDEIGARRDAGENSDNNLVEIKRSKSAEKSEIKDKREAESGSVSIPKSLLSSIKGVDPSTPMSKELEDLSKIGARGSLEITLVKKDAQSDKAKEDAKDVKHKMEEDVLTITDASKRVIKPSEKKSDDFDAAVIEISDKGTPPKKKKPPPAVPINVTPRRSSRNLNKSKTYSDKDMYIEDLDRKSDDEIEEVIPTDPLAEDKRKAKKTTIVVNDTKKLVEIAAGSKQNKGGKKEPTLVIIDTNSILSGKGAVPVSQTTLPQMSITPAVQKTSSQSFSPMMMNSSSTQFVKTSSKSSTMQTSPQVVATAKQQPQVLPTLTDDMYVVEAPSFIVPYVYEKPPVTSLRDFVDEMGKTIKVQEKEEKKKRKEKSEDDEKKDDKAEKGDTVDGNEEKQGVKDDVEKTKTESEDREEVEKIKSDTESDEDAKSDTSSKKDSDGVVIVEDSPKKKSDNYFDNPLGKLFMQIGLNQVQEMVQTDLLRTQKRKRDKDEKNCPPEVHKAINSLIKSLEITRDANKAFKLELQKCSFCNFKTESTLVMAHHLETPHMRNYIYRCNFCTLEVRSPHDILFHMEAEHKVRGRLERAPAFHQCPNCPFEDNQKGKLSRHLLSCSKKYKPERNQEPPLDWEPPAKIPRIRGTRPTGIPGGPLYQAPLAPRGNVVLGRLPPPPGHSLLASGGRGRPPIYINRSGNMPIDGRSSPHHKQIGQIRPGIVFRPVGPSGQQVVVPQGFNNMYQKGSQAVTASAAAAGATAKLLQQPSISITPLPRQTGVPTPQNQPQAPYVPSPRPGRPPTSSAKTTFVICEICDGYIKDLEQLRNHMQWIHKVKIHPKMIYNRPPLNCQKCQFRFFTDQGLERHLLGTHGLVTSSMQEAANKGKDGGRCPVCGRVYQWKLLNHVARDHNMSLKPAHLSYKCTVCTATFGMYKQFESHVYSAHSVVSKRPNDKKPAQSTQPSTSSTSQPPLSESGDDVNDDDGNEDEPVGVVDDGKNRPLDKTGRQPVDIQSFTKTLQGLGTVITLKAASASSTNAPVGTVSSEDGSTSRQNRRKKAVNEAKSRLKRRETRLSDGRDGDNASKPTERIARPDGKEQTSESMLKPLKINDEITIIPQPARAKSKTSQPASSSNKPAKDEKQNKKI